MAIDMQLQKAIGSLWPATGRRALVAEFIGTFFLVLFAAGAGVVAAELPGSVNGTSGALAPGIVLMVLVLILGPVCGAHFNPAVSLGMRLSGRLRKELFAPYVCAQVLGALGAALLLKVVLRPASLGLTEPHMSDIAAWPIEAALTFLLMTVILSVTEQGVPLTNTALAIGGTIAAAGLWAGPLTGASLNPARSLGPALAAGEFQNLWIYVTAPFAGSWAATVVYDWMKGLR